MLGDGRRRARLSRSEGFAISPFSMRRRGSSFRGCSSSVRVSDPHRRGKRGPGRIGPADDQRVCGEHGAAGADADEGQPISGCRASPRTHANQMAGMMRSSGPGAAGQRAGTQLALLEHRSLVPGAAASKNLVFVRHWAPLLRARRRSQERRPQDKRESFGCPQPEPWRAHRARDTVGRK